MSLSPVPFHFTSPERRDIINISLFPLLTKSGNEKELRKELRDELILFLPSPSACRHWEGSFIERGRRPSPSGYSLYRKSKIKDKISKTQIEKSKIFLIGFYDVCFKRPASTFIDRFWIPAFAGMARSKERRKKIAGGFVNPPLHSISVILHNLNNP